MKSRFSVKSAFTKGRRIHVAGEMPCNTAGPRHGFTLVELLVVIAIIGILIALLLPAVQAAREAARRMQCTNNLKQVALSLHNYHNMAGSLPFGASSPYDDRFGSNWAMAILPQMEQQQIFDQLDFTYPMWKEPNATVAATSIVSGFICPSDPWASKPLLPNRGWAKNSPYEGKMRCNPDITMGIWYVGSIGPTHVDGCPYCLDTVPGPNNWCCRGYSWGTQSPEANAVGMFHRWTTPISFQEVTDGLSKTIMIGETIPSHCMYNGLFSPNHPLCTMSIPLNTMYDDGALNNDYNNTINPTQAASSGFKSLHPGGASFAMGDGSVHFIVDSIDHQLFCELGTRDSGEVADLP